MDAFLLLKLRSRLTDSHFISIVHNLCVCHNLSCMCQAFYSKISKKYLINMLLSVKTYSGFMILVRWINHSSISRVKQIWSGMTNAWCTYHHFLYWRTVAVGMTCFLPYPATVLEPSPQTAQNWRLIMNRWLGLPTLISLVVAPPSSLC